MVIDNNKIKAKPKRVLVLPLAITALLFSTAACSETPTDSPTTNTTSTEISSTETHSIKANTQQAKQVANETDLKKPSFNTKAIAAFNEPWAMSALPSQTGDSIKLLVTQKTGELYIVDTATGQKKQVGGVPKVAYGGQGGLGDIILAPDFARTNTIYLSYIEAGTGPDNDKYGAQVIKAKLTGLQTANPSLQAITPIWQQTPKVEGQGHYSHRLLFSPDGQYLYISSGERQKKDPAQDMAMNLGKIIRLNPDGSIPADNPFVNGAKSSSKDISAQFWSIGHRNILGMTFDDSGRLWEHEMGPRGGDEFNLITKGDNYGWPIVSNGRNYSGTDIPDHDTRPEFTAPKISWTPVISPSAMSIYRSAQQNDFPAWQGKALISGLSSKALIVVTMDQDAENKAYELYRYDMGERIRSVLTVDGSVFLLEDGEGDLLKLLPN